MEEEWGLEKSSVSSRQTASRETFVFEPHVSGPEEPSASDTLADFSDPDITPVDHILAQAQREAREQRNAAEIRVVKFLAQLPEQLSLPAVYFLAKESSESIAAHEEMYRHLDNRLKDILRSIDPAAKFFSFDTLLTVGSGAGRMADEMRQEMRRRFHHLFSIRTLREVSGLLQLFAAFAENIANAKYLQEHPEVEA